MNRLTEIALRVFLGGTFLYAGIIKAPPSAEFAATLAPFTILPEAWIPILAAGLPLVEVAAGLGVLLPWTKRHAAALLLILCLVFIALLTWALANGIIVSCGCFGQDTSPSATKMLLAIGRDIALAAAAGAVAFWPAHR